MKFEQTTCSAVSADILSSWDNYAIEKMYKHFSGLDGSVPAPFHIEGATRQCALC